MTTTHNTTALSTSAVAGHEIVLFAKVGSQRFTLTAVQLRDTVASYLSRGEHMMPTRLDLNGGDPNAALHVIVEEWLWGNVTGWTDSTDIVHLTTYRHAAMRWSTATSDPPSPKWRADTNDGLCR